MLRKRLVGRLLPYYLLLTSVTVLAVAGYALYSVRASHREHLRAERPVRLEAPEAEAGSAVWPAPAHIVGVSALVAALAIGVSMAVANRLGRTLDNRIRTVISQRNQLDAVLSSMVEGVVAVDNDENVISLNQAAAALLEIEPGDAVNRNLLAVIRNDSFREFVGHILSDTRPAESEIVLNKNGERIIHAHGAVLRDARGQGLGAVVVLHDVTRLRRLEQVRRDFVANVSHELRTPITSIKGFVETLLDGALADPAEADRFLRIVAKQADRLVAILEDLLALSRMEQEDGRQELALDVCRIRDTLQAAVQLCLHKARDKGVDLDLDCPEDVALRINAPLIEQAVSNLIDNAVKYSEPGGAVRVSAAPAGAEVVLRVEDHGCGIAPEHLPRLFERFYRVDKARSRGMGGTGLGLAIVKHIARAHGGSVHVESELGKGSTFQIRLPRA